MQHRWSLELRKSYVTTLDVKLWEILCDNVGRLTLGHPR